MKLAAVSSEWRAALSLLAAAVTALASCDSSAPKPSPKRETITLTNLMPDELRGQPWRVAGNEVISPPGGMEYGARSIVFADSGNREPYGEIAVKRNADGVLVGVAWKTDGVEEINSIDYIPPNRARISKTRNGKLIDEMEVEIR